MSDVKQLNSKFSKDIVGQKVVAVQIVNDADIDVLDSFSAPIVEIHLENGVGIYAQADDEFNAAGIMVAIIPRENGEGAEQVYLNYEEEKEDE